MSNWTEEYLWDRQQAEKEFWKEIEKNSNGTPINSKTVFQYIDDISKKDQ